VKLCPRCNVPWRMHTPTGKTLCLGNKAKQIMALYDTRTLLTLLLIAGAAGLLVGLLAGLLR
jgi:hypothetical protein